MTVTDSPDRASAGTEWPQSGPAQSLRSRERRWTLHRLWIGDGPAPADELHTVSLVGNLANLRPVHRHQMKHIERLLVKRACPASARIAWRRRIISD